MKFTVSQEARELHARALVVDMHHDTLLVHKLTGYDMTRRHRNPLPFSPLIWNSDLPRLLDGGVDVVGFGLVLSPFVIQPEKRAAVIFEQVSYFNDVARQHPDRLRLALSPKDITDSPHQVRGVLGIEGAHALAGRLEWVEMYYRMGVRYLTLSHFSANAACCPAMGWGANPKKGLTDFGREMVAECNRLGLILDLAHVNKRGFMEAAKLTRAPFIVSHTGFKGTVNSARNIDDEQLRAVADTQGVAGVIFAPSWTGGSWFSRAGGIADAIIYAMDKFGADYVGLGSDIDGFLWCLARGIRDVSDMPVITELLLRKGKKPDDILKVLGGNFLRVFRAVAAAAKSTATPLSSRE